MWQTEHYNSIFIKGNLFRGSSLVSSLNSVRVKVIKRQCHCSHGIICGFLISAKVISISTCQWPVHIHSIPHSSGQFNSSVCQPFGQQHIGLFSIRLCAFRITLVHCHKYVPSQGCWGITQHRASSGITITSPLNPVYVFCNIRLSEKKNNNQLIAIIVHHQSLNRTGS